MKKFLLLLLAQQCLAQQSVVDSIPGNWNLVFEDAFTTAPVNTSNWKIQNEEYRWLQEQVFLSDQVQIANNELILGLEMASSYIADTTNPLYGDGFYRNGNGKKTKYKAGEIFSKQKLLYGYIEARVKLPTGKGAFPGFWLSPMYRERETASATDGTLVLLNTGYPEEMDIIEQRAILTSPTVVDQIYDYNSFSNGGFATGNHQTTNYWEKMIYNSIGAEGVYHTFGLKWDLFGQYLYLDGNLIYTNPLWSRKTNTEAMNVVLSNQILTDTDDPDRNPDGNSYLNSPFEGHDLAFPDGNIAQEKLKVDWVKVWQEKKFKNPVVWASGKSDKLGKFTLEVSAAKPDVLIVGNFISDNGDEILSFSGDGLRSAMQKPIDQRNMYSKSVNAPLNIISQTEYGVWDIKTIKEEKRTSATDGSYTLNNWFSPTTIDYTRYTTGNFDGSDRDQLFLSNNVTKYAVLLKFSDTQNNTGDNAASTTVPYAYSELDNNGGAINAIKFCDNGTPLSYTTQSTDIFLSGNLDAAAGNDELFVINPTTGKYALMTKATNTCGIFWKYLTSNPIQTNAIIHDAAGLGHHWTMSANDQYIVDNFNKTSTNDTTDELLCINKVTGLVRLYRYDNNKWYEVWGNDSINTTPKSFKDYNISAAGNDTFISGSFLNNGKIQLLCLSNDQRYSHLYQFNGPDWEAKQHNDQIVEGVHTDRPNASKRYLTYKYESGNPKAVKTTLFTSEKYRNPYNSSCTDNIQDTINYKKQNCVKYSQSLTDFSSSLSPTYSSRYASETDSPYGSKDLTNLVKIYPNPTKGNFRIDLGKTENGNYTIFNELSQTIKKGVFENESGIDVNLSGYPKGIYFISIDTGLEKTNKKIVLQ